MLCRTHERDAYGCLQCKCARYWPKVSFGMLAIMIYFMVLFYYYKTYLSYKITQYLFSHSLHQKLTQCGYVIWRFDFLENIHWNHLVWEIPQKKFLRLQLESTTVTTIWWNPYSLESVIRFQVLQTFFLKSSIYFRIISNWHRTRYDNKKNWNSSSLDKWETRHNSISLSKMARFRGTRRKRS